MEINFNALQKKDKLGFLYFITKKMMKECQKKINRKSRIDDAIRNKNNLV